MNKCQIRKTHPNSVKIMLVQYTWIISNGYSNMISIMMIKPWLDWNRPYVITKWNCRQFDLVGSEISHFCPCSFRLGRNLRDSLRQGSRWQQGQVSEPSPPAYSAFMFDVCRRCAEIKLENCLCPLLSFVSATQDQYHGDGKDGHIVHGAFRRRET